MRRHRRRGKRPGGDQEPAVAEPAIEVEARGVDLVVHADAEQLRIAGTVLAGGQRAKHAGGHEEPAVAQGALGGEAGAVGLVVGAESEGHGVAGFTRRADGGGDDTLEHSRRRLEPAEDQRAVGFEAGAIDMLVHP